MRRFSALPVLSVLAVLSLPAPARAGVDLSRLGPELQVNPRIQGHQTSPAVAGDRFGNFVVVWVGPDAAGVRQVFGQRLDAAGTRRGGEFQISSGPGITSRPRVAVTPDGGFVAVWIGLGVRLRLFDPDSAPRSKEIRVDAPPFAAVAVDVAVNGEGEILVLWTTGGLAGQVFARRYDSQGHPLEDPFRVRSDRDLSVATVGVAEAPDGDFLAAWSETTDRFFASELWMRRFDDGSATWADAVRVEFASGLQRNYAPTPVFRPDGSFFLVWTKLPSSFPPAISTPEIHVRSFGAGGAPIETLSVELFEANGISPASVALDRNGNALVVIEDEQEIFGTLFDRSWQPLTDRIQLHPAELTLKREPALAADALGNFLAVWTSGLSGAESPLAGSDGDGSGIFGQRLGNPRCAPGAEVLCLGPDGRFEVRVSWKNPFTGQTGTGRSRPLTADTGALWFFGAENLELLIKVLDARTVNGHFWVYYGALSNVEYTITVTDTATGKEKTYHNPAGQLASRADAEAFKDAAAAPAPSAAEAAVPDLVPRPAAAADPADCAASGESLCLNQGRFQVQVDFTDPRTGAPGHGQAVPLTADTGSFWFFGRENLELMIKVLDGRTANGHFWVYYGALSDVAYTITVTDTETDQQRIYRNDRGRLASRADIEAFPGRKALATRPSSP